MMYVALTYDHRIIDGFFVYVKDFGHRHNIMFLFRLWWCTFPQRYQEHDRRSNSPFAWTMMDSMTARRANTKGFTTFISSIYKVGCIRLVSSSRASWRCYINCIFGWSRQQHRPQQSPAGRPAASSRPGRSGQHACWRWLLCADA